MSIKLRCLVNPLRQVQIKCETGPNTRRYLHNRQMKSVEAVGEPRRNEDGSGQMRLKHGAWIIDITWQALGTGDTERRNPAELRVYPADGATPAEIQKGLTTSTLRQVEMLVSRASKSFANATKPDQPDAWTEKAEAAAADLRLRDVRDDGYSKQLLETYALFERVFPRAPAIQLADRVGIKPGAMRARLRTARVNEGILSL